MKVLHVWNIAGVASIIAKYMDRLFKTESNVVMRKQFDKFGLTVYGERGTEKVNMKRKGMCEGE